MDALAVEVETPTSKQRPEWAAGLLREMHGECRVTVGMLEDLSDDCANLIRRIDKTRIDAVEFATCLEEFFQFIKHELRPRLHVVENTVADWLAQTPVAQFGVEHVVVT